jgi:hypothetical protein
MSYFKIQQMRRVRKLSKRQERKLKEEAERLKNMPDSEIDTSDIPELTHEQLSHMMSFKKAKQKLFKRKSH